MDLASPAVSGTSVYANGLIEPGALQEPTIYPYSENYKSNPKSPTPFKTYYIFHLFSSLPSYYFI